jgi:RES domain-containing protein
MVLWRISRHRELSGVGGLRAPGRWHYAGQAAVYLAESPPSALLEVCVHTSANDVPPEVTLLKVEGPDLEIFAVTPEDLPQDWRMRLDATRNLGTSWLRRQSGVLLKVPSAIVPETSNFLLNPLHADAARLRITDALAYPFDIRLKT